MMLAAFDQSKVSKKQVFWCCFWWKTRSAQEYAGQGSADLVIVVLPI